MVLDLDELAVAGRPAQPQDGTLVNPRMARRHAVGFPGLEQNRRQCVHRFVNSRRTVSFAGRAMKPETNPRGKGILRSKSEFEVSRLTSAAARFMGGENSETALLSFPARVVRFYRPNI